MIHVKQTRTYEGKDYRGNCYAACIASILEVPLDSLPELHGREDAALNPWLALHFPGVTVVSTSIIPQPGGQWNPPALGMGYWIACVESPRFREPCNMHVAEGGTPHPPFWYDLDQCPHCGGSGERPGFHAIVARGRDVVHDPHPDVTGYGWDYNGLLCGGTWFVVTDPSRLIARLVP